MGKLHLDLEIYYDQSNDLMVMHIYVFTWIRRDSYGVTLCRNEDGPSQQHETTQSLYSLNSMMGIGVGGKEAFL